MVSFRTNASRVPLASTNRPAPAAAPARPFARTHGWANPAVAGDAAIRREFEALAARIRTLQQRAAREAALLAR